MSDLSLVRLTIADPIQFGISSSQADGQAVDFLTTNCPIYPGTTQVFIAGLLASPSTYVVDESVGLVTFNNAPEQFSDVEIKTRFTMLSDQDLTDLLTQYETDGVKLAAADALDIIASSQALIQKKLKLLDTETDGPALAKSLRDHAAVLRLQVYDKTMNESTFDVIEQIQDNPSFVEKVFKDLEREGC